MGSSENQFYQGETAESSKFFQMLLTHWKKLNAGRPGWLGVKRHGGGAQLCLTCVHSLLSLGLGRRGLCILQRRWDREATQRFKETGLGGGRGAKQMHKQSCR
jgi:hypothetical protein